MKEINGQNFWLICTLRRYLHDMGNQAYARSTILRHFSGHISGLFLLCSQLRLEMAGSLIKVAISTKEALQLKLFDDQGKIWWDKQTAKSYNMYSRYSRRGLDYYQTTVHFHKAFVILFWIFIHLWNIRCLVAKVTTKTLTTLIKQKISYQVAQIFSRIELWY